MDMYQISYIDQHRKQKIYTGYEDMYNVFLNDINYFVTINVNKTYLQSKY